MNVLDHFTWGDDKECYIYCSECEWYIKSSKQNCEHFAKDHWETEHEHVQATVILFKPSGKYYTEERWKVPEDAIGPFDMINSPDFRRIGNGAVLVDTQEPWGYPHLFPNERSYYNE